VLATRTSTGDDDEEEWGKLESPRHRQSRRSMNLSGNVGRTRTLMGSFASSIGMMGCQRTDCIEQVDDKP
jgi:E3 ubiquitin-protein ligase XBAT32/33